MTGLTRSEQEREKERERERAREEKGKRYATLARQNDQVRGV